MRAFLDYYKWHITFIALFVVCISIFVISSCTKSEPDLVINVISEGRINIQTFEDRKGSLTKLMLHDADKDGKKTISMVSYPFNRQSDMDEALELLALPAESDIIITTKNTLIAFKDKSLFTDMREFVSGVDSDKYTTLKDSSGRVYAVSLENNDFIEDMGFFDTTDLYITVVADDDSDKDGFSESKKNAHTIVTTIIKGSNLN